MKNALTFFLILLVQSSFAQFQITYIKSADTTRTFLLIDSKQYPDAARRMNAFVQKDWGYDPTAKDPFENLAITEEADFHYEPGVANSRIFSMVVVNSYAAAGLHIDRRLYLFDSKTGNPIDNNNLFSAEGMPKLKKALHKSWKAAIKAAAEDKNESRASEYKDCLAHDTGTELEPGRMLILDQGIQFWAGSCLEGTAYDFEADRGTGPHTYPLGQLLPMLSQYGFSLFVDKGKAPFQTLLRGTIDGKYPVSLMLLPGKDAGTISGMLVYDRVGEPINLGGTTDGNHLKFHELDETGNPLSNIDVSWDGTKLTGSFINLKANKQMGFDATIVK